MPVTQTLLHIIGAVCLLLWGTRMVRTGFSRAYGTALRSAVRAGTNNRFLAFLSGLGITALLQSSTAAIFLVSSFVKKSYIGTTAALAVIIGADLSTTLVAQILTLDLAWLSPALLTLGIITYLFNEYGGRARHIARAVIGIGLMLLSLTLIREASAPLKTSEVLPLILQPLYTEPALAIVFAALFTWLLHSSLAAVLLFAAMAASGIFPLKLGLFLVLGANLGGAFIPFIATYRDGPKVWRITFGNLVMRSLTVLACVPLLPLFTEYLQTLDPAMGRQIVNFHTGFNLLLALIFLPLAGILARTLEHFLPDVSEHQDKNAPLYLDEKAHDAPVIALASAARETLRMAEVVEDMLEQTIKALERPDEKLIKNIENMDDTVDRLNKEIKLYMTRLSWESFDPKEADRYIQILTFATNLESCGDIIDKNLMELARKKMRKSESFSKEGMDEIRDFHGRVLENLRLSQTIFLSEDPALASSLVEKKRVVREAEIESSRLHFNRLREGLSESIATSSLHLDIIRDLRRINSYVTSLAYTIIDNHEKHKNKRVHNHPDHADNAETP